MSETSEASLSALQRTLFGELNKRWGWLLVSGLVSILLGGMILAQWLASGF